MSDKKNHGWKLEGELAIESGAELLEIMADRGDPGDEEKGIPPRHGLWVGDDVLSVGWALFQENEDGEIEDVPARKVAKAFFDHGTGPNDPYYGYDGRILVSDEHREIVKQLCEKGVYTPKPRKDSTMADKLAKVKKKVAKKPGVVGRPKKDDKAE